jgi:hypothetical protein
MREVGNWGIDLRLLKLIFNNDKGAQLYAKLEDISYYSSDIDLRATLCYHYNTCGFL